MFGAEETGAVIQLGVAAVLGHLEGRTKFEDIAIRASESSKDSLSWLCPDEETQFKIFIGALAMKYKDEQPETYNRILTELRMARGLNAAISGIPVDLSATVPEGFVPIGLQGIWQKGKFSKDINVPDLNLPSKEVDNKESGDSK